MVADYKETNAASNITSGGNLNINSTGATNIMGSELTTANDTNITAASLNVAAAQLQSYHNEQHMSSSFNIGALLLAAVFPVETLIASEFGASIDMCHMHSSQSSQKNTTNISSLIQSGGNTTIGTTGDTTVMGSNIVTNNDLTINTGGNLSVLSAQDTSSYSSDTKDISLGKIGIDLDWQHASFGAHVSGSGSETKTSSSSVTQVSSNLVSGNNLNLNINNNLTLVSSTITADNQANISVTGDTNILTANNTYNFNQQQSQLSITLGAKVGNAYVDTGYAGYGLYEATKQLADASAKLDQLIKLRDEGKASDKAVAIASAAVAIDTVNLANATLQLASSVAGSAAAAADSLGTGMYGALYADMSASTSEYNTISSEAVASSITSNNNFTLNSNNANLTGSIIGSTNNKTTLNINNNLTLLQSENDYSLTNKSFNTSIGMQLGTAGYQPNQLTVGFSDHESEQVNYVKAVILEGGNQVFDGINATTNGSKTTQDQSNIVVNAGSVDSYQNNLKDYTMIDADSDAQMSIDLRVVTEAGRKSIGDDLNNIKTGKFITDNVNVMKTNVNTVKNLGESAVNDMTFGGTYEVTQKSFENQTKAMNGELTPQDLVGNEALSTKKS